MSLVSDYIEEIIELKSRITKAVEQLREEARRYTCRPNDAHGDYCNRCFLLSIATSLEGETNG